MKKSTRKKVQEMKTGAGECLLASFEGDGEGGFNFALEDDKGKVLQASSHLHSRKDCELTLACYLLIKNGIEPTFFVHRNKKTEEVQMNITVKKVTTTSVKQALGLDKMSTLNGDNR